MPPPPPPPRTERDKYGGLFYLGIGGLALLVVMIAWFGYSVWQLRDVWAEVYALHDPKRSDAERIESAVKLSRDPRVTDRQLMEICLRPRPARSCPVPAGRGRLDRSRGVRPPRLRPHRGLEPGLARLAAPRPVAAAGLRCDPRLRDSRGGSSTNYRSIRTR